MFEVFGRVITGEYRKVVWDVRSIIYVAKSRHRCVSRQSGVLASVPDQEHRA